MKRFKYLALTAVISLFSLGLGYTLGITEKPVQTAPTQATEPNAATIYKLVNQERVNAGLTPLQRYDRLDSTAYMKTNDMVANNYFDHSYKGERIYENIIELVPDCEQQDYLVGENLAITNQDSKSIVDGWMDSETHRKNMMRTDYTKTGVSVIKTNQEYQGHIVTAKITQHFCK